MKGTIRYKDEERDGGVSAYTYATARERLKGLSEPQCGAIIRMSRGGWQIITIERMGEGGNAKAWLLHAAKKMMISIRPGAVRHLLERGIIEKTVSTFPICMFAPTMVCNEVADEIERRDKRRAAKRSASPAA